MFIDSALVAGGDLDVAQLVSRRHMLLDPGDRLGVAWTSLGLAVSRLAKRYPQPSWRVFLMDAGTSDYRKHGARLKIGGRGPGVPADHGPNRRGVGISFVVKSLVDR